ncbi:GntR family transcriptional regulator [Actinosynnema sp. NPDC020468]|uniref:GntR family transcriptional regulator n=1 Tax=Actinosynnema sp. NPDC020468 TaxID=3154488 RepID=UPI0033DAE78E
MTTVESEDWLSALTEGRDIDRSSTAERVAEMLRARVLDGVIKPGQQLNEKALGEVLKVSRNTLREAFRLLAHERLLVHTYSKGVFVRKPEWQDIVDLYAARRVIETGALRLWAQADKQKQKAVADALQLGIDRQMKEDWAGVASANNRFHQAVVDLAGSSRLNEEISRLLAELRLAFHVIAEPHLLHADFLRMHELIVAHLDRGELREAEDALGTYFDRAEKDVTAGLRSA